MLDYKKHYKMIPIDLSKQQVLDTDPNTTQQLHFNTNLDREGNSTFFFSFLKRQGKLFWVFHKVK